MILNRESDSKYVNSPENEDIMEDAWRDLDEWLDKCDREMALGNAWVPDELDVREAWDAVIGCYDRIYHWKEWIDEDSHVIFPIGHPKRVNKKGPYNPEEYLGYSKNLFSSILLKEKSLIKHVYDSPPPEIEWTLTEIKQGGKRALIGDAIVNEINAVSSVPWIDPGMKSEDFASKVSDPRILKDEWQRVVDIDRIEEIAWFANQPDNSMFNPVTLFVDLENPNVSLTKIKRRHAGKDRFKLNINFDFLSTSHHNKTLTDYVVKPKERDLRPLWIVDGQHRVRGYSKSWVGFEHRIPIVVLTSTESDDGRRDVAKIFTEINTLAEPVKEEHQLFLMYRFGIKKGRLDDWTIEPGSETKSYLGNPNNSRSRINRRTYELALHLSKTKVSALNDSIHFSSLKTKSNTVINIKTWMKSVRTWFQTGNIYGESRTDDFSSEEVNNFFLAFAEAANGTDWPCSTKSKWGDKLNRWNIPTFQGGEKPLVQQAPFQSLLLFYPEFVRELEKQDTSLENRKKAITKDQFKKSLESTSIPEIDWRSGLLEEKLGGRNNSNFSHLKNFMITAVKQKAKYGRKEVMSADEKSQPGKGILAPPARRKINFGTGSPNWPRSSPVILEMNKPHHSNKPSWDAVLHLKNGEAVPWKINKGLHKTDGQKSTLSFNGQNLRDSNFNPSQIEKIVITGLWQNGCGDSTFSKKELTR
tara:strand:- start:4168 stop:6261 length:2094 start_codon:yes stop_codon:yes gene_type:complete